MSQPVTPAAVPATPPRPPDPDTAHLRHEVRRILADSSLARREADLIAAAQEYAAALIEKCARPPAWDAAAL